MRWSRPPWALGFLVLVGWAGAGCDGGPEAPPSATKLGEPLRVAAAADLQIVLPKLIKAFEESSGVAASATFGASGNLAAQIRQGAPFDVFLSADLAFVEELGAEGSIEPGSIEPYALGSLVLVVHPAAADAVNGLADLPKPEVSKLAIANPQSAPYGRAARQALERSDLWTRLEPKIVLAESVRQALVYEEQGDAEAALISRSLIDPEKGTGVEKVISISPNLHAPLVQGLGIVARSKAPDQARAFADFVRGAEGRLILREAGFEPPQKGRE